MSKAQGIHGYQLPRSQKADGLNVLTVTTQSVGEEGAGECKAKQPKGDDGLGPVMTTLAVGEEGGGIMTQALGEEGLGIAVELLENPKLNSPKNDSFAYGRAFPGEPAPLFGVQYRISAPEARKLVKAIEKYDVPTRAFIVREMLGRNKPNYVGNSMEILSSVAANVLNGMVTKLGIQDDRFTRGEIPFIHPVG